MRGHLQQRSRDTWRLKVYVGRSADGRKRYVERTIHGSRREAERELARLVVEVDEGRHVAATTSAWPTSMPAQRSISSSSSSTCGLLATSTLPVRRHVPPTGRPALSTSLTIVLEGNSPRCRSGLRAKLNLRAPGTKKRPASQ